MKFTALTFALSLFFFSCNSGERIINNTDVGWSVVGTTSEQPSQLVVIHQPDNVIKTADAFSAANGASLSGTVKKIVEFDTALYLLIPDTRRIEVISRYTYKRISSINTSPHIVVDLCFANATTAYTANTDSTVSILDVTVFQLLPGRDIGISGPATSIAALGNQICVCCQTANTISIIDSRINEVTKIISTPSSPTFVGGDKASGNFTIVCLGDGKNGLTETMSPAHVVSYSPVRQKLVADVILNETFVSVDLVQPRCLYVAANGSAYVGLDNELVVLDAANGVIFGVVAFGRFSSTAFNFQRNELALLDQTNAAATSVTVYDLTSLAVKSTTTLSLGLTGAVIF